MMEELPGEQYTASMPALFVGRTAELAHLDAGLEDALGGRGRVFLITGDAGIGKSRLAREVAERAGSRGTAALWGRCWESGGAPSFWPWVQALRGLARSSGAPGRAPAAGNQGEPGLPELAAIVGAAGEIHQPTSDRDQTRFLLFDATVRLLCAAAAERPLLLVLEDLHAADVDSLLLLRFVSQQLIDMRMLLVGTYRDSEARAQPQVGEILGGVARDASSVPLRGWSESEVAQYVDAGVRVPRAGARVDRVLTETVCRITEGNPFFVEEIVRLWNAEGLPQAARGGVEFGVRIPDQVRDAVRRRLALLPPESAALLNVASVIGREFEVDILSGACGAANGGPHDLLAPAVTAGVIAPVSPLLTRYSFSHVLIRDTLYHDLPAVRRAELHRRVAVAIETVRATALEAHFADLARHYLAAGESGGELATSYALRAAEHATAACAYADAVGHCERALEAFAAQPSADPLQAKRRRCDLLLRLGAAQNAAGQRYQARDTFRDAAKLARELSLPEDLARAALGFGGSWDGAAEVVKLDPPDATQFDDTLPRLLREALDMLGDRCPALRARLLSRLAVELYFTGTPAQREVLAQEAITLARRLSDPLALATVLWDAHLAVWGPDNVSARRGMAEEVVELGERAGDYGLQLHGRAWLIADLLELGDGARLEIEFERFRRLAEAYRQPMHLWAVKNHCAQQALLTGDYADAERFAQEALGIGQGVLPAAFIAYGVQMAAVQRDCGRFEELAAGEMLLRGLAEQYPGIPSPRVALTHLLVVLGRLDEARVELDRLAARDFEDLARDLGWTSVVVELAEICAALGDRQRAGALYPLLLPCAAYVVVSPYHATCWGSVARSLGVLATMLEDWTAAEAHFAVALERNRRLRARPWIARAQLDYARMLCARHQPGDPAKARALLEEAEATADALGMRPLSERIRAVRQGVDEEPTAAVVSADPLAPLSSGELVYRFSRRGQFWQIAFGGDSCTLKDTRGLQFIARLLQSPQRELHALDLVQGLEHERAASSGSPAGVAEGDSGPLLDPQARTAYKQRLEELGEELEEAQAFNDAGRAERVREEIDFLTRELTRAFGIGGRERRAGSNAERARINVTRAIAAALKQIGAHHPPLSEHLKKTIRTGTFCSYNPDPRVPIDWQL